ncbi:hypothetical protein [Streptomyces sp. ME19-01-6]|uniref:hypothetical protein n=1 Tax=Streptomyces sp. ME19-01-6 TaxID=3028686 RepID=UPI0029B3DDAB|nr:hypothetical protein [Streptomyces sp. ME19-01-6]MDX3224449.1 hypothetical protein [Streptomyces sp. ME19-01-6]
MITAMGPKACVVTDGRPVPAAKAVELDEAVRDAEATKVTEAAKPGKLIAAETVTDGPIRTMMCPFPPFPPFPDKTGKCRVLVVKGTDQAWKKFPVKECRAKTVPATPRAK